MPRDFDVRTMKGDEVEFERAIFESARLVYSFDASGAVLSDSKHTAVLYSKKAFKTRFL